MAKLVLEVDLEADGTEGAGLVKAQASAILKAALGPIPSWADLREVLEHDSAGILAEASNMEMSSCVARLHISAEPFDATLSRTESDGAIEVKYARASINSSGDARVSVHGTLEEATNLDENAHNMQGNPLRNMTRSKHAE